VLQHRVLLQGFEAQHSSHLSDLSTCSTRTLVGRDECRTVRYLLLYKDGPHVYSMSTRNWFTLVCINVMCCFPSLSLLLYTVNLEGVWDGSLLLLRRYQDLGLKVNPPAVFLHICLLQTWSFASFWNSTIRSGMRTWQRSYLLQGLLP